MISDSFVSNKHLKFFLRKSQTSLYLTLHVFIGSKELNKRTKGVSWQINIVYMIETGRRFRTLDLETEVPLGHDCLLEPVSNSMS